MYPQQPIYIPQPPQRRSSRKKVIGIMLAVFLLFIGSIVVYALVTPNETAPQNDTSQSTKPHNTNSSSRIVFLEQTGIIDGPDGRGYPEYELWIRDNNTKPRTLGTYGKAGKYLYPESVQLNRKGDAVYLIYETSLEVVSITSKKITTLYTAPESMQLTSFVENQSGTAVLVMSAGETTQQQMANITIERVDVSDGASSTVYSGQRAETALHAWASDNTVVFSEITYSEFTRYGTLDLKTKTFGTTTDVEYFSASRDGKTIAVPTVYVDDVCNMLSGSSPSGQTFIASPGGTMRGSVTSEGIVNDIELSDDGKKALLSIIPVVKNESACEDVLTRLSYASYDLMTKKLTTADSYRKAYESIYPNRPYVELTRDGTTCKVVTSGGTAASTTCGDIQTYTLVAARNR